MKCCNGFMERHGRDNKSLQAYLHRLEEAEKRDHRLIAKKMDLFHLQPEAPGMVFWHPNGWSIVALCVNIWQKNISVMVIKKLIRRSWWTFLMGAIWPFGKISR